MAKKSVKKNKTFHVPITVTISGHETVEAKDWQDAIEKAKKQYFALDHDNYCHGVDSPSIDIDFADCEEDIEVDDE